MGLIKYLSRKINNVINYVQKHDHTVWGKITLAVLDAGVSYNAGTNGSSINIGDTKVIEFKNEINQEEIKDDYYVESNDDLNDSEFIINPKVPDLSIKDYEPLKLGIDSSRSLVERVINIFSIGKFKIGRAIYEGAVIIGELQAQCNHNLAKMYYRDAEIAIGNYIDERHNRNEPILKNDFENFVKQEIDFAMERHFNLISANEP